MLSSKLSVTKPDFLSTLKFQSCLGQGGFGIVFKAIDVNPSSSSPETAVKFIFPEDSNEKEQQQILRECTLAAEFNHENVVQILTVAALQLDAASIEKIFENVPDDDDRLQTLRDTLISKAKRKTAIESICIRMPLCGENLRKWLHLERDANNEEVHTLQIKISHGIASGLKYLHDKKIVHRDLKPENVMFSHEKFQLPVKIGDFGLCRIVHSSESQTSSLTSRAGTQEYMAPEAFTNDYSCQADLFSLGLVIWEVFQFIPFHDRRNLFDKLVNDKEEDLLNEISSSQVRKVVLSLTRKKKVDRMQSVDEIVHVFNSLACPIQSATNSEELGTRLEYVANGGRVVLGEGEYEGEFVLEQDNVEIVGAGGAKTILKGLKDKTCLAVRGSGCKISDIKVIPSGKGFESIGIHLQGSRNAIQNVEASGGGICFNVVGEGSRLEYLTISDAEKGISLERCRHIVDQVKMDNISICGISISSNSDYNTISNVTSTNVRNGIWVGGSSNNFSNIDLVKLTSSSGSYGVHFTLSTSYNTVYNLNCSGYFRENDDWGLKIDSSDSTVKDSNCGPVLVDCRKNLNLTNVDCGEKIKIRKDTSPVFLTNCRGQLLATSEEVSIIDCKFDKIVTK